MTRGKPQDDSLFELCKLQAATAGAFSETLLQHFYKSALQRCAKFVGWSSPVQQMNERVVVAGDGTIKLSHIPSSDVLLMSGAQVVERVPQPAGRLLEPGHRAWCCHCHLQASYTTGRDLCNTDCLPEDFKQAVCRVFAYLVENRGEEDQGRQLMTRSGAIDWLRPYLTTVL